MQTISLSDRVARRKFTFTGPETYDDLSGEQLVQVIGIKTRHSDEFLAALEIVNRLFNIDPELSERLTTYQKLQLTAAVQFTFDEIVKMDRWLFSSLPGTKLSGPADGLENITFEELMHADQRLDQYRKTGNEAALNELVAVLMRPEKLPWQPKGDDKRKPFNDHNLKKRAAWIGKHIELTTRQAIHFNYVACRSRLSEYFTDLFPPPDENNPPEKNKPATDDNWLDVAIDLARKEPVLGNLHDIEKDNAYLVLRVLNRVIRQHKAAMAELERMN